MKPEDQQIMERELMDELDALRKEWVKEAEELVFWHESDVNEFIPSYFANLGAGSIKEYSVTAMYLKRHHLVAGFEELVADAIDALTDRYFDEGAEAVQGVFVGDVLSHYLEAEAKAIRNFDPLREE